MLRRLESRGKHETAHRTKQRASQVFRYAIATGRAERDPTQDLRGALAPVVTSNHPAITDPKKVNYTVFTRHLVEGSWHRGRVVLVGNAAVTLHPVAGQGFNLALRDVAALAAAGVVGEAMVAMVLADAMLEKFGGDSLAETRRNHEGYLASLRYA